MPNQSPEQPELAMTKKTEPLSPKLISDMPTYWGRRPLNRTKDDPAKKSPKAKVTNDENADPEVAELKRMTAFMAEASLVSSIKSRDAEGVDKLLRHHRAVYANGRVRDESYLVLAAKNGANDVAKVILNHGAYVDTPCGVTGRTPLAIAIEDSNVELVRMCVARGADLRKSDRSGHLPVHLSVRSCLQRYNGNPRGQFDSLPSSSCALPTCLFQIWTSLSVWWRGTLGF